VSPGPPSGVAPKPAGDHIRAGAALAGRCFRVGGWGAQWRDRRLVLSPPAVHQLGNDVRIRLGLAGVAGADSMAALRTRGSLQPVRRGETGGGSPPSTGTGKVTDSATRRSKPTPHPAAAASAGSRLGIPAAMPRLRGPQWGHRKQLLVDAEAGALESWNADFRNRGLPRRQKQHALGEVLAAGDVTGNPAGLPGPPPSHPLINAHARAPVADTRRTTREKMAAHGRTTTHAPTNPFRAVRNHPGPSSNGPGAVP